MLDFPCQSDYGTVFDGNYILYLSHGHRTEPKMKENSIYMTGHTHVPKDEVRDGIRYVNPGSVSIPKEDSPHSAIVYNDGKLSWIDIVTGEEYDPKK